MHKLANFLNQNREIMLVPIKSNPCNRGMPPKVTNDNNMNRTNEVLNDVKLKVSVLSNDDSIVYNNKNLDVHMNYKRRSRY